MTSFANVLLFAWLLWWVATIAIFSRPNKPMRIVGDVIAAAWAILFGLSLAHCTHMMIVQ